MSIRTDRGSIGLRAILLIIAIIIFAIAALGVDVGNIALVPAGLAFFAAAFLVP